jgi:hypothetical protein
MYPVKITNHVEQAKALLLYQFRNSPNIQKVVEVFHTQIQNVENEYFTLLESLGIDTAYGYALDVIGKEVQEDRQSRTDEEYRSAILTKIFINNSSGTPEEVIAATLQITGATTIKYSEQYPAAVVLEILGADYVSKATTIRKTVPAAVDLVFGNTMEIDTAQSYSGAAYTQQVLFESNPVYTDLMVGGYLVSTGQLSENTTLYQP